MLEHSGPKVVVGISPSLAGLAALRFGVNEAGRRGIPLVAVRSWPFGARWYGPSATILRQQYTTEAVRAVADAFDAAMGGPPADVELFVATPCGRVDLVLTHVADGEADLLVLGGRSSWWPSWIVRGCTRRARCPVVVVPPPALARASARRLLRELTNPGPGAAIR